ncbi:MAG: LysR family transcriptional regulator [Oscillospiraceae bacterium]|nr:LysR family transcriptional regulator [Oscillospiraceae bacterium]
MNSRQLQYAILLSQVRNFSQAAEKLNISQPALSKQILNLENELGVRLFDRNSSPLALTAAGSFFLREAEALLYKEDQLLRSMERFQSGEAGDLVIGITPFRSAYLIPNVIKQVRQRFPGIRIRLHEAGSDILRKEAAEGRYDFAVVNLPVDDSVLEIRELEADKLVLAVPRELLHLIPQVADGDTIRFSDCASLPFAVVGQNQEMRILFDRLCATAGFTPNIAVEVVGLTTAWSIARSGVAATILPWQFVEQGTADAQMVVVGIKDAVYTRRPAIVTRRDQYITAAAEYAISLLMEP